MPPLSPAAVPPTVSRRGLVIGAAALAATLPGRSARAEALPILDDASGLNPTRVARHVVIRRDRESDLIAALRRELTDARSVGRPVCAATARHSMGGQSLAANGTALTFENGSCEVSLREMTCRVTAGTRWREVIATLDPLGCSPAVTQSNNDFGAGGTVSVNAHGWPVPFGPFGSTVRSIDVMLADGSVVTASRSENADLFRLVIGGYGLVGIVLRLDLDMVRNEMLQPRFDVMPSRDFGPRFVAAATSGDVRMCFGRLTVARSQFLDEALLVSYAPLRMRGPLPSAETGRAAGSIVRSIYRAQTGSERGKQRRWYVETVLRPRMVSNAATRNKLLNTPVSLLENRDMTRTDILHEYFVPAGRFTDFLTLCRSLVPRSKQELLNVTLRYVAADTTSVLAYAPEPRIAAVMAFSQLRTVEAEEDMRRLTEELIEGVLALGGSFYLPYRLHARPDQVERAYPGLAEFLDGKTRYDPGHLFRNAMWTRYWPDGRRSPRP